MNTSILSSPGVHKLLDWLLISASLITIAYLLYYHASLATFPWPVQYREGAILLSTDILLHGGNPYSMELQPYYANSYGFFYNLLLLPFAWMFGPSLILHKVFSGVMTLLTLALLCYSMKRHSVPLRYALPMTAMLYSSLLYSKTSLAEPDSTGTFILFAAILIPVFRNFSPLSLGLSILLSGFGFFTKPYFVFGIAGVAFCLLFARQWKKLCIYSLASVVFIATELLLFNTIFDSYLINVLLSNYNYGKDLSKWSWILTQLTFVFSNDKFFFSTVFAAVVFYWTSFTKQELNQEQKNIAIAGCAMLLVFLLFLGKNTGAYATYLYQLPLPFLCLTTASILCRIESCKIMALLKLSLVFAMLSISLHYPSIADSFGTNGEQWKTAQQLIHTHTNILNSPAIAPLLIQEGKTVYDSGQTGMFFFGIKAPGMLNKDIRTRALRAKQQFGDTIYNGVAQKKFDLIMIDREYSNWILPPVAIMDTYSYKGLLTLEMPHNNFRWQIDIWEPRQ